MVSLQYCVSTLLEIQLDKEVSGFAVYRSLMFQPFLRFNEAFGIDWVRKWMPYAFQPFLRFNGSCVRFL